MDDFPVSSAERGGVLGSIRYLMGILTGGNQPMQFTDLKMGMRAVVKSVIAETVLAKRLQEMGLVEGTEFLVKKVAPLGDPVEIEVRGYRLCLRKQESAGLEIELVN